jgi:hypothetical protein
MLEEAPKAFRVLKTMQEMAITKALEMNRYQN